MNFSFIYKFFPITFFIIFDILKMKVGDIIYVKNAEYWSDVTNINHPLEAFKIENFGTFGYRKIAQIYNIKIK